VFLLELVGASLTNALEVPGTAVRGEASGYLDGLAVIGTEGGQDQRPQALGALRLDATLATLGAHAELRSRIGGPFEGGHAGFYNFVHTFQNLSPSVEVAEGYVNLRLRQADFQAGIQKFAWGKLDGLPPTDVLNPRDYHDPFVVDFEEAKVGVPALAGTLFPPDVPPAGLSQLRLTLIYIPLAVPWRSSLLDERWFPQSAVPQGSVVLPKGAVERRIDRELRRQCPPEDARPQCNPPDVIVKRDVVVPTAVYTANHRPPLQLDAGGIAVRVGGMWRDVDWDLYHYSGPETGPDGTLSATVTSRKNPLVDAATHTVDPQLRSRATLRQRHSMIHMTGADGSAVIGGVTVRAEAAFFRDRPYLRIARDLVSPDTLARLPDDAFVTQLSDGCSSKQPCKGTVRLAELFPKADSVEWGVGADYMIHGFFPIVQVNQIVLLDSAPHLLINDPETRLTAIVRRRFLQERLELEFRGVYALERASWLVFPRVAYYVTDDLRVRLGYLALGGDRDHLIGQFRENDEVVMQVRYTF
jgi:hypothetical protein